MLYFPGLSETEGTAHAQKNQGEHIRCHGIIRNHSQRNKHGYGNQGRPADRYTEDTHEEGNKASDEDMKCVHCTMIKRTFDKSAEGK